MSKPIQVLEINNIDIYGRRFNGYSITEYIDSHPNTGLTANFIVNHKLGTDPKVAKLFPSTDFDTFDWQIEEKEQRLGIKNQISISENALISHPLYQSASILHFHMYHNSHFPVEFLTRIPPEKKIVIDIHDTFWLTDNKIPMLEVFSHADGNNKKSLDAQRKRVLNSIDAQFIAHSPFIMNLIKQSSATNKLNVKLINFGIDTEIFKPLKNSSSLRKKYHIPEDHLILMCRSQKEFKGIDYIAAAIPKLKLSQPITLITVGVEGLLDSIKKCCNLIEFGTIGNEQQMTELYNLCDIFLAPSTEESFGFMAVEAMSCAKPVIVFKGTALPDTVHAPTIGIATDRSATALAEAITNLANKPKERHARGNKAREYVLKNHTEKQYFESYVKLFQDVAKTKLRHVIQAPPSTAPKNLHNLPKYFDMGVEKNLHFDYNNVEVQKAIQKYNTKLYQDLQKKSRQPSAKKIIKKIIPSRVKNKLRSLKERLK